MKDHSEKISLALKIVMPILKLLSAFITLVRETGEEMGKSISELFIKDSNNAKAEKIRNFGEKTGGFIATIATLGVFGTYIIDISETNDVAENGNHNADEKIDVAGVDRSNWKEVDINNDGIPDAYDTDGDGIIDHNKNGVPLGDLKNVSGYTREDGTHVDDHIRTEADGTTKNNIRV